VIAAKVIGLVVATQKDPKLQGRKLLVVQPVKADGSPIGKPMVAVDCVGSGAGELVMLARSRDAALAAADAPVDLAVVGIADSLTTPNHTPVDLASLGFKTGGH
jgi:microcompartment protein CcmK/EutM